MPLLSSLIEVEECCIPGCRRGLKTSLERCRTAETVEMEKF